MNKELAIKIAKQDPNVKKTSELMKKANEVYASNSSDSMTIFPQSDIVYATFVDYIKESCSQREKDLLIISEFLNKCWSSMHISIQTLREEISTQEKNDIKLLVSSLQNLELLHLLTDGLNKHSLKKLNEFCENNIHLNQKEHKRIKIK